VAPYKQHWIGEDDRKADHQRQMDMILHESHFNFIKIYLLSYLFDDIRQFGNILMYSSEFGELASKEQIQD